MYYKTFYLSDEKIIGKSPHVSKMYDNYPLFSFNSVRKCRVQEKIDVNLNLDYFVAHYHSKLLDILHTENLLGPNNYLVSPRMIEVFRNYNLPSYQVFPANVMYHKQKYNYFLIHFYEENLEYIDFVKSEFVLHPKENDDFFLDINSHDDYKREFDNIRQKNKTTIPRVSIRSSKLFFKPISNDNAYDLIQYSFKINPGIYINDKLKIAIEKTDLTGWEFTKADGLSHQVISMYDVGKH